MANFKSFSSSLKIIPVASANKWSISDDRKLITGHCNSAEGFSNKQHFQEISCVLIDLEEDPFEGLELIDALQRLGIDHHFQKEIEAVLHCQHKRYSNSSYSQDELYKVSTRFRLLRQEGYTVNPDVFGKFMNNEGKLKPELSGDIRGLIGLYEASQLSMEGEDILDQAGEYSAQLLNKCRTNLDHHQARIVGNTLRHPYHKSLSFFFFVVSNWQDENQDGTDGSFVECYMEETGCSDEIARKQVTKMISDSWKRLNKETLYPSLFSATFRKGCLNLARMVPLMYSYDENSSLPILQKHMKSILYENIA